MPLRPTYPPLGRGRLGKPDLNAPIEFRAVMNNHYSWPLTALMMFGACMS